MAKWILGCPNCKIDFTHCEVEMESRPVLQDPFAWLTEKPKFPVTGMKLQCPNCKTISVYKRTELIYRAG